MQDEMLLISLNDKTGKYHGGYWRYALNGAALAELLLSQRIELRAGKVEVKSTVPVGDEALDVALCRIAMARRALTLQAWVRVLYRDRKLPFEVLTTRLIRQGILSVDEARMLWVFRQTVYPTRNPVPEQQVIQRVRDAMCDGAEVAERTAILIALLQSCRAVGFVLSKTEVKQSRKAIERLCKSSPVGEAIAKALSATLAEDETAMICATIVASS
ncbi:MAG TPA: GPP34 family phosphoprotein [Planctomycetota bacterium]